MLSRTHLAITLFFILLFFPLWNFAFCFVALIATILPDIDTKFSKVGKHFKILNFFTKHRGIIHSFSFLFLISVFISLIWKEFLFPFVFGYSIHLIADFLTVQGIRPFYPLKIKFKGKIKTGGIIENFIFLIFLFGNLILVFKIF